MLKKLIKYDVRKMIFNLPYFYLASLVFALLTRFVNIWKDIQFFFILGQIFQGTTIALIVNSLANTILGVLVRSFRASFYGDESYLTHTLPTSKNKLLLSKFLSALIVVFLTILVILLCLIIMFYSSEFISLIKQSLSLVVIGLDISPAGLITIISVAICFQLLSMLLMGFASIVKGHSYNNGKIAKSFLWFGIFYVISGIVSLMLISLVLLFSGNIEEVFATVMKGETFIILIVSTIFIYALYTVAFYLITNKLFNKGVNVD